MNLERRKRLSTAATKISDVKNVLAKILEVKTALAVIKDEEETAMENVPESLQETDRYQEMEEACDIMEDAMDICDELMDKLQKIDGVRILNLW